MLHSDLFWGFWTITQELDSRTQALKFLDHKTLVGMTCITRPDTSFFWLIYILLFGLYISCFSWKTSTWSKGNKNGNSSPHNCCLIFVLHCSSLLNRVLGVLASSRAWRAYVLACLRAWRVYVLTCLACLRACVITCLVCLHV